MAFEPQVTAPWRPRLALVMHAPQDTETASREIVQADNSAALPVRPVLGADALAAQLKAMQAWGALKRRGIFTPGRYFRRNTPG